MLRKITLGALLIVLIGLTVTRAANAHSNCMASCAARYYECTRGFSERSCSTQRSICSTRCVAQHFGAIAYSSRTGAWGTSWRYASKRAARARAMRECGQRAGAARDCRVVAWFYNSCGALVLGLDGAYGASWGSSISTAARKARKICRKYSDGPCEVREAFCSGAR